MTSDSEERTSAEAVVVAGLRAADPEVFRELVTDLNPGLVRMARIYVTPALADEVVQDTWMAVVTSIGSFEGRASLKTWVYRIMLNKVRTVSTREAKIVPFAAIGFTSDDAGPAVDPDRLIHPEFGRGFWSETPPRWETLPAERLEAAETRRRIDECIAQLPPAQREVVSLRDVEGWTSAEVCNALDLSLVNQRVLLHRGRVALRAMLEEYLRD